ncbi:MAG: hypothetical protein ACRC4M_05940 [Mycoplasma sp.]
MFLLSADTNNYKREDTNENEVRWFKDILFLIDKNWTIIEGAGLKIKILNNINKYS